VGGDCLTRGDLRWLFRGEVTRRTGHFFKKRNGGQGLGEKGPRNKKKKGTGHWGVGPGFERGSVWKIISRGVKGKHVSLEPS